MDASKHEMKVRGVTWGGTRFVPSEAGVELNAPDISTAPNAFKQIAMLGANVVRVDVSSAANDDVHRITLQKLQRLAHARGLILLLANVPLTTQDQSPWLSTLAGWFPRKDNVWYLPAVDPNCGMFSATNACGDTEAWIWSQTLGIQALRSAGVRTPIVVNLPNSSRSVALNWTTVLGDENLIYGVHPPSDGQFKFKQSDAKTLMTSLEAATEVVPVLFDDVARVQMTTSVDTMVAVTTARLKRTTRSTTDSLRWSQGLLDWVTGWTVIDGGDGAIVSGWDTPTRDAMSKGRKKLTTWGRAAASGYFAIGFRAQSGRNPGSDFPGGFKVGDSGPGVRAMQEDLARLTYLAPRFVTGSYDDATWQAVVGFQGYSRLERNGVASALTVASLMRAERPQARHLEGPAHVEVDLDRQVLMLVHGSGVVTRLIH
ncbi:MAG: peptidoglycan-binding domain-containing protein, partial [Actinobacteria bacterium]|nr:peptidoglycan-binding domain-containing protein [Actinomycetota bacterium]